MNNGKICISICAETAEDLIAQIKRAEILADVIEIRFDCLHENEFDAALQKISVINCKKPFLATFRPKNKCSDLTPAKRIYKDNEEKELHRINSNHRINVWEKLWTLKNIKYVDFEYDLFSLLYWTMLFADFEGDRFEETKAGELAAKLKNLQIIFSEHYFLRENIDLNETFEKLSPTDEELFGENAEKLCFLKSASIKIAIQADDVSDTIGIWKLLERTKNENQKIIPIAMGESGKWTRILGIAHGAFMTYAALDDGKETAPGQVSAKDLIEVYRVKNLNEQTEIYGIIGGNTSYSMSPFMHNAAFKFHKLNAVFVPLQTQDLDEFIRRMVKHETREIELNFKGFSVTNPHKQNIIKHLDFIDETAKKIGAVNTVEISDDGKLHGYNTDAHGFITPLLNAYGDLRGAKVAVFGAGGAARACIYALKNFGAEVTIFARDLAKSKPLAKEFQIKNYELQPPKTKNQKPKTDYKNFDIIVNSTPLGTRGELENETIVCAEQIEQINLVYDLVYNPFQTKLMSEADRANVPKIGGMAMLIAQAMEQQKIWTGLDAPMKEMSAEVLKRLQ